MKPQGQIPRPVIDPPPVEEKTYPENWMRKGKHRLDAVLNCMDRLGLDNRQPLSTMFGKIRESGPGEFIFDQEECENFTCDGQKIKAVVTVVVEFLAEKKEVSPKVKANLSEDENVILCLICGKPVPRKCKTYNPTVHIRCRAKKTGEERKRRCIDNLKAKVCNHYVRGMKSVFPCDSCKRFAWKYDINIKEIQLV